MRLQWLIILFLFSILAVNLGYAQPIWVTGQVTTTPTDKIYDTLHYWEFNLTIADTNGSLTLPMTVTAVLESSKGNVSRDLLYNLTGQFVEVQSGEIPLGYFVVETVNQNAMTDWWGTISKIIAIFSGVVQGIAESLSALVFALSGVQLPPVFVAGAVTASALLFLWKYWKTIGLFMIVVLGYIAMSGGVTILRLLFWS